MLSDTEHQNKFLPPSDLEREIEYDEESDTLWLGNGKPAPGGMDLFPGCIVFFDKDGKTVTGVMLRGAKYLLQPVLYGEVSQRNSAKQDA